MKKRLSGFYILCALVIEVNYKTYIMWPIMLGFVLNIICGILLIVLVLIYYSELNANDNN